MRLKPGYMWVLLMLANAAGASPPEPPQSSEIPLLAVQQLEDDNKRSLTQPVALTQQEKQWAEYLPKGKLKGDKAPASLTLGEQEHLMWLVLHLKGHINKAKRLYQQALAEQEKQWEKQGADNLDLEEQQWWKSRTPDQKKHWNKYTQQQEQANVHLQNEILGTWGDNIAEMTRFIEMFDTDRPVIPKRQD